MSKENVKLNKLGFEEDPRYAQCNKEAIIGILLGAFNFLWWYLWGFGLGDRDVEEYSYIFGLPDWFFMSCVVGAIVIFIIVLLVIKFALKHMSLEALSEEELEAYREEQSKWINLIYGFYYL